MVRTTVVLVVVVVALSAYFIWPTPYVYPFNRNPSVRLSRFTHKWEKFDRRERHWRLANSHDFLGQF